MRVETSSPAGTERVGRSLGRLLREGDLVLLSGELGAGKTRFVKGLAAGAGVARAAEVVSPTFLRLEEYGDPPRVLRHVDAYRMAGGADLEALGGGDLQGAGGFMVIEWPEHVEEALPPDGLLLRFSHRGPRARRLDVTARGPRGRALLRALRAALRKGRG
ncbi:MAG: tRNA (adenosine(37)-N6)-threonylcarbamoyltransferase complex ATPase subunit type 1 TsaE [Planctomycetes bacterium]|nr:tRNA (adenosine(37)-N6)-threonylcarbamoyltransferase complex ATPase subunit type 1 TsaE [Planctomycetota bacterium]